MNRSSPPSNGHCAWESSIEDEWITFEGKDYPLYVVDILQSGMDLIRQQNDKQVFDPSKDICDVRVKIGDLGNACWDVSISISVIYITTKPENFRITISVKIFKHANIGLQKFYLI